jgi:signal peptidase II
MKLSSGKIAALLIAAVLLLDQSLKVWIKTNFALGDGFDVIGQWFKISFTENPGMAFGMSFGGEWGKLFLSLFRIGLVLIIGFQLVKLSRKNTAPGVMIGLSLILAGAAGNIIDSMFYGLLFSESTKDVVATCGHYAPFLHGHVVDMLYFPLIDTTLPSWMPFWGGKHFVFFNPIFNIADASITIGVFYLLLFQRKFFLARERKTAE